MIDHKHSTATANLVAIDVAKDWNVVLVRDLAGNRRHFKVANWLADAHIQPGRPMQNSRIESFHGKLRDEFLNVNWFRNLFDARRKIAWWRREYNE